MSDGIGHGPARTLRAGPLTLAYEGAGVRWIRAGNHEVLRGIYVAVRDAHWRTIPAAIRDLTIDARDDSFRVELIAEHQHLDIDFRWRGTIVGERSGALTFTMDGAARRTFRKNRIGLCVLHPMEDCSGRPCTIEHGDGHITSTSFPALVSPHQPFLDVRAIAHEVAPGVIAEVRVEGDVFETEDQRNWSDTSFKTYSTPVDRPFPVEIAAGTPVRQEMRLRLRGAIHVRSASAAAGASPAAGAGAGAGVGQEPVRIEATDASCPVPRLGMMLDVTRPLSARESARLRAIGLSHVRVDLDLAEPHARWREALREAASQAEAIGASLQIAVLVPAGASPSASATESASAPAFASASAATSGSASASKSEAASEPRAGEPRETLIALAEAAAALRTPIDAWLIFDRATGTTPASLLAAARDAFTGRAPGRIGGGSNVHFADLNRHRPPAALLDLLAYPMSPQAHAVDIETMVENLGALTSVAETARSFAPDVPLAISPVTLKPRSKSGAPVPSPLGRLPDDIDERQTSRFAAAWTIAHLRAAAEAGVESVTYFRTVGWDGVMEREEGAPLPEAFPSQPGMEFPVCQAIADIGAFAGGRVHLMRSSDPRRVDALCLERDGVWRLLLVNLRAEPQRVQLPPMRDARGAASPLDLDGHATLRLDFERRIKKGDSVSESPFI